MTGIEYVIYCRKSTDESSGMQVQSIPDQIKKCIEYAKNNGLKIKEKPQDFSDFETELDIKKEDTDTDINSRRIYKETRNLFIIKEQKSWKEPWIRPKWRKLIKQIESGKIKGLLSYSPDRQARNILEWWELINLVDEWMIDLKYTNFHFENNASGKMMLGIWFVFSKQYSDKLSEDITRWNKTTTSKGKSLGKYKYGYYRDEETGYYMKHPEYFSLMQKAFKMKLYENKSDDYIANWLNSNWFYRETKKEKNAVSFKRLGNVWRDEFYYGLYFHWDEIIDQRELNPYYEAMITETEHQILYDRYHKKNKQYQEKKQKDEYYSITPIPQGLIKVEDGYTMTRYITPIGRFKKKLEKLQKDNPKIVYWDFVKSSQIRYRMANKKSKFLNLEIKFDVIEKEIIKKLDTLKINESDYQEFVSYINNQLEELNQSNREERNRLTLRLNKVSSQRTQYIKDNMKFKKDKEELAVYENERKKFDMQIESIKEEIDNIEISERDRLMEFEVFINILQKSGKYYRKANYVQKAKIFEAVFLNIVVNKQKRLTLAVKPWLESLFSKKISSGGDGENRTRV